MKPNIDLTQNRTFSQRNNLRKILRLLPKCPWNIKQIFHFEEEGLVYTGNKKERAKKKDYALYENNLSCERCGINLSLSPWKMGVGLCQRCDNELSNQVLKKEELLFQSSKKFIKY